MCIFHLRLTRLPSFPPRSCPKAIFLNYGQILWRVILACPASIFPKGGIAVISLLCASAEAVPTSGIPSGSSKNVLNQPFLILSSSSIGVGDYPAPCRIVLLNFSKMWYNFAMRDCALIQKIACLTSIGQSVNRSIGQWVNRSIGQSVNYIMQHL